jgi:hypothetical protein
LSPQPADAENLQPVLTENAEHLMSSGDYRDEMATTVAYWREQFALGSDGRAVACSFGMWPDGREMVGRIVLVPVDPPAYGMGYWVTNPQQRKGFASASVIEDREPRGHARRHGDVHRRQPRQRGEPPRAGEVRVRGGREARLLHAIPSTDRPHGVGPYDVRNVENGAVEPDSHEKRSEERCRE